MIDSFCIERFKLSCNLLYSLSRPDISKEWSNPSNFSVSKDFIHRGSFMDCIEYLYGFVPEVLKEDDNVKKDLSSLDKKIGWKDVLNCAKDNDLIDLNEFSCLYNIFRSRGYLIHDTLVNKELYFEKLSYVLKQIEKIDLKRFYNSIIKIIRKINSNESKENLVLKSSKVW